MSNVRISSQLRLGACAMAATLACLVVPAWAQTSVVAGATEPSLPYTIKPKDKLIVLSQSLLVEASAWSEVARFNQLKNPNLISPGQEIKIPLRLLKPLLANGKVISVEGDVKLGTQTMRTGTALPEGARLQTGANSSAVVELGDGSRVQILPNSIAQVITQRRYSTDVATQATGSASTTWFSGAIRLVQGTIDTIASKTTRRIQPLEISTPTSVVGVRGTQFRVAYEDPVSQAARTEVTEGNVRTDNPKQGVGTNLTSGFGAVVKPNEREIKAVALLAAPDLSALPAEVNRKDNAAAWPLPSLAGAASYKVQLARDAGFLQLIGEFKAASGSVDLAGVPNGVWHARVRGIDAIGLEGFDAIKMVQIKDAPVVMTVPPAPRAVWPSTLSVGASARALPNATLLLLNLSATDTPMALVADIAPDAQFSQPTRAPVVNGQVSLPVLNAGQAYFLRISAASGGSASVSYRLELPDNWAATVMETQLALQQLPVR
jgi:hypothetical protein